MRLLGSIFCIVLLLHCSFAPPVTHNETKTHEGEQPADWEEQLEYHRYLKEVVQALESDPDFKAQLEKADEDDIRSGKIAEQLDLVNHNVRTRLDEIKRRELSRLRHLATKQFELTNNIDDDIKHESPDHLDHGNSNTFEIDDLKKLIKKVSNDLEIADQKRKEEFKQYELEKEFQKHQEMEKMDEPHKKEYLEKTQKEEEAKKHHEPLHHPASREQLLDIWRTGGMDPKDFDPQVFYMMHDVDGNGVWDADEVKALFVKELNKMYGPDAPVHDMHERYEEMERMREHVFKENDINGDGLIDFHEFMKSTQKHEFNEDKGWQPIDQNTVYTQAEYQEFEKMRLEELRYLQQRGLVDTYGNPVPGAQHQIHQARQQFQAFYLQQKTIQHINQFQGQPPLPNGQHPPVQAPGQFQQPQGYPQQGNQGYPQQGNQGYPQQGNQGYPQQGNQGYQQGNQGYQQGNQGYQQGNQQYGQPQQAQYQAPPQGQAPQGQQSQGQAPPQGQQPPIQVIPAQQVPVAQQSPQGQVPLGQVPQGQVPQGQVPQSQQQPVQQSPPLQHGQPQQAQGQVQSNQISPANVNH